MSSGQTVLEYLQVPVRKYHPEKERRQFLKYVTRLMEDARQSRRLDSAVSLVESAYRLVYQNSWLLNRTPKLREVFLQVPALPENAVWERSSEFLKELEKILHRPADAACPCSDCEENRAIRLKLSCLSPQVLPDLRNISSSYLFWGR